MVPLTVFADIMVSCTGMRAPRRPILLLLILVCCALRGGSAAAGRMLWQHNVDGEPVVVLTYATGVPSDAPSARRFCAYLESLAAHRIVANPLGWGSVWTDAWARRVELQHEVTSRMEPNVTVVWTDAFDVLFADDLSVIYRKFAGVSGASSSPGPVLYSAECNCYPLMMYHNATCARYDVADAYPCVPAPRVRGGGGAGCHWGGPHTRA